MVDPSISDSFAVKKDAGDELPLECGAIAEMALLVVSDQVCLSGESKLKHVRIFWDATARRGSAGATCTVLVYSAYLIFTPTLNALAVSRRHPSKPLSVINFY